MLEPAKEMNGPFAEPPTPKVRPNTLAVVPWSGENPQDYFSCRDGLVSNAIVECTSKLSNSDGSIVGSWLLTEISYWDNEKERLVLLTSKYLFIIKYDFITLKVVEERKVPLEILDTMIIGQLSYPPTSLIPRLDGLATGVTSIVKGCLVRPIQGRLSGVMSCSNTNFKTNNFEARSRNMSGVRLLWNHGRELPFVKRWNPFERDIPFCTFTSHPLLWHKEGDEDEKKMYSVDDFTVGLKMTLESNEDMKIIIQHRPILLENYVGVGALIHNKNSLGFFKVRGKFSF